MTDLLVLSALLTGPAHGYSIAGRLSDVGLDYLSDASVYAALKRLLAKDLVEANRTTSRSGPPKRDFTITSAGLDRLNEGLVEVRQVVAALDSLTGGSQR